MCLSGLHLLIVCLKIVGTSLALPRKVTLPFVKIIHNPFPDTASPFHFCTVPNVMISLRPKLQIHTDKNPKCPNQRPRGKAAVQLNFNTGQKVTFNISQSTCRAERRAVKSIYSGGMGLNAHPSTGLKKCLIRSSSQ